MKNKDIDGIGSKSGSLNQNYQRPRQQCSDSRQESWSLLFSVCAFISKGELGSNSVNSVHHVKTYARGVRDLGTPYLQN